MYRVNKSCACGRRFSYPNTDPNPPTTCPVCWGEPDLTDAEAAVEDSYTVGDD